MSTRVWSQFLTAYYYGCCFSCSRHRSEAHRYLRGPKGRKKRPSMTKIARGVTPILLFFASKIVTSGTYFENDRGHKTEMSTRVVSQFLIAYYLWLLFHLLATIGAKLIGTTGAYTS